jgi:lysozyme family protein
MVSDIERERGKETLIAYAFVNDAEDAVNSENLSALTAYGIKPILWSRRETEIIALTA